MKLLSLTALAASLFSCAPAYAEDKGAVEYGLLVCSEHRYTYGDSANTDVFYDGQFFQDNCPGLVAMDMYRKAVQQSRGDDLRFSAERKAVLEARRSLNLGVQ